MKKLLPILLLLISSAAFAQKDTSGMNLPMKEGKLFYEGVVEVPGKTQNQLYASAKTFLLETFNSAKDVIQSDDKDAGRIAGKGIHPVVLKVNFMYNGNFNDELIIQVDCKDGKYRYRFYAFTLKPTGMIADAPNKWPEATYDDFIANLTGNTKITYTKKQETFLLKDNDDTVKGLINTLRQKMTTKDDSF